MISPHTRSHWNVVYIADDSPDLFHNPSILTWAQKDTLSRSCFVKTCDECQLYKNPDIIVGSIYIGYVLPKDESKGPFVEEQLSQRK